MSLDRPSEAEGIGTPLLIDRAILGVGACSSKLFERECSLRLYDLMDNHQYDSSCTCNSVVNVITVK